MTDWKVLDARDVRDTVMYNLLHEPTGIVLRDIQVRESLKNGEPWVKFPARSYPGRDGQQKFVDYVGFISRDAANRHKAGILEAVDRHNAGADNRAAAEPRSQPYRDRNRNPDPYDDQGGIPF